MPINIPIINKNDVKIFILFLMNNIGIPLTFTEIADIITIDGIVRYFDFAEAFTEMLDRGLIRVDESEKTEKYFVDEEAREYAATLESDIAKDIRQKSLYSAIRHIDFTRREIALEYGELERSDGKIVIHCRVTERKKTVYEITIAVDTEEQAYKIKRNFYDKSEVIYRGSLALLAGDVNYLFEPQSF